MRIAPLAVAGVAGVLLLSSVAFDLAFGQTVTLSVRAGTDYRVIGEGALDSTSNFARPMRSTSELPVGPNDTLEFRVQFQNGYPWPSTKTFALTADGCYQGTAALSSLAVAAPASGTGEATARILVKDIVATRGGGAKLVEGPATSPAPTSQLFDIYLCLGDRYVTSGTITLPAGVA